MPVVAAAQELASAPLVEALQTELATRIEGLNETGVTPALGILSNNPEHEPSQLYIATKRRVAARLGITVRSLVESDINLGDCIDNFNQDDEISGFLLQLPLLAADGSGVAEPTERDQLLSLIRPHKDVDGLGEDAVHTPATAQAVDDLLEYYGAYDNPTIGVVLGQGKLVGGPYMRLAKARGVPVLGYDRYSPKDVVKRALGYASFVVTATGDPTALRAGMFEDSDYPRFVVDAGAAEKGGRGDLSDEMRDFALRHDWSLTPRTGGVGPLAVHYLMRNTVAAAETGPF